MADNGAAQTPMRDLLANVADELESGWRAHSEPRDHMASHQWGDEVSREVGRIIREALSRDTGSGEAVLEEALQAAEAFNEEEGDGADTLHHGRAIIERIRALASSPAPEPIPGTYDDTDPVMAGLQRLSEDGAATDQQRAIARAAAAEILRLRAAPEPAVQQQEGWKGQNYARDLRANIEKALAVADKVLGGPEGDTVLGYTLPSGLWLMLQANARNLLDTLLARRSVEGGVPEGMVLVPREPTEAWALRVDLERNGVGHHQSGCTCGECCITAVLAASPQSNDGSAK